MTKAMDTNKTDTLADQILSRYDVLADDHGSVSAEDLLDRLERMGILASRHAWRPYGADDRCVQWRELLFCDSSSIVIGPNGTLYTEEQAELEVAGGAELYVRWPRGFTLPTSVRYEPFTTICSADAAAELAGEPEGSELVWIDCLGRETPIVKKSSGRHRPEQI